VQAPRVAVVVSERRCADQGSPQGDEERARGADAGLTRREVVLGGGALALAAAVAAALEHGRFVTAIERG
jgi:hypothetical protein